jgi:hypothetical protein
LGSTFELNVSSYTWLCPRQNTIITVISADA